MCVWESRICIWGTMEHCSCRTFLLVCRSKKKLFLALFDFFFWFLFVVYLWIANFLRYWMHFSRGYGWNSEWFVIHHREERIVFDLRLFRLLKYWWLKLKQANRQLESSAGEKSSFLLFSPLSSFICILFEGDSLHSSGLPIDTSIYTRPITQWKCRKQIEKKLPMGSSTSISNVT